MLENHMVCYTDAEHDAYWGDEDEEMLLCVEEYFDEDAEQDA